MEARRAVSAVCRRKLYHSFSLSPPHANLRTVYHPAWRCFLSNLSFASTPRLWLLTFWGFCGMIYMGKCERESHRADWCLWFISLAESGFLENLGSKFDTWHCEKQQLKWGIVSFAVFYSVCTFAFDYVLLGEYIYVYIFNNRIALGFTICFYVYFDTWILQ